MVFRVLKPFMEALLVSGARTQLRRPGRPRCRRTANQVSPAEARTGRANVGRRCVPGAGFGEQDVCVTRAQICPLGCIPFKANARELDLFVRAGPTFATSRKSLDAKGLGARCVLRVCLCFFLGTQELGTE